jgi:hypothetical protein
LGHWGVELFKSPQPGVVLLPGHGHRAGLIVVRSEPNDLSYFRPEPASSPEVRGARATDNRPAPTVRDALDGQRSREVTTHELVRYVVDELADAASMLSPLRYDAHLR